MDFARQGILAGTPRRSTQGRSGPKLSRAGRNISPRPLLPRALTESCEAACRDGVPDVVHQALVISDVDLRQQHRPQRLARSDEVMQIGARIAARGRPRTFLIERSRIVGMAGIAQVDLAEPCERHAVPSIAS